VSPDPRTAPARTDLPYLRHRARPRAAQAPPQQAAVSDFIVGRAPHPQHHPAAPPAAPAASSPPAPAPVVSSSLDLDEPTPVAPVATAAPAATAPTGRRTASPATPERVYPVTRVHAGARTILTVKAPTVTLTRTQTGIGTLTFEAACSDAVGDLRLGCAYQLRSGMSSTVQSSGGNRFGPAQSRRPVIVGAHDRYERLSVDLRQCLELERLAVFAFSESRAELSWGGTLITSTYAGAKIELPLEELTGQIAVLMSLYNVHGEFVLRAEMEPVAGSIREACRAYGYDTITWLDDRTPVD
jgi:uncharacterized protein involved in tellurium resistance